MTSTQGTECFSNSQWLEIIAKLQKPNPPSKWAIACEYCVSNSAITKLWGQKNSTFKYTELVPESTRISTLHLSRAYFPELEDQLFLWVDSMKHLKLELPPTLVMTKVVEITRSLNIKENKFKSSWGWFQNFRTWIGWKEVPMFGEGAKVDKIDPQLLESLNKLYEIIRKYPPSSIYNIDETGLFHRLLPHYSLLMPNEDVSTVRGKKESKRLGDFGSMC